MVDVSKEALSFSSVYKGTEIINSGSNTVDYWCYLYGMKFPKERVLRERGEWPRIALQGSTTTFKEVKPAKETEKAGPER